MSWSEEENTGNLGEEGILRGKTASEGKSEEGERGGKGSMV